MIYLKDFDSLFYIYIYIIIIINKIKLPFGNLPNYPDVGSLFSEIYFCIFVNEDLRRNFYFDDEILNKFKKILKYKKKL